MHSHRLQLVTSQRADRLWFSFRVKADRGGSLFAKSPMRNVQSVLSKQSQKQEYLIVRPVCAPGLCCWTPLLSWLCHLLPLYPGHTWIICPLHQAFFPALASLSYLQFLLCLGDLYQAGHFFFFSYLFFFPELQPLNKPWMPAVPIKNISKQQCPCIKRFIDFQDMESIWSTNLVLV